MDKILKAYRTCILFLFMLVMGNLQSQTWNVLLGDLNTMEPYDIRTANTCRFVSYTDAGPVIIYNRYDSLFYARLAFMQVDPSGNEVFHKDYGRLGLESWLQGWSSSGDKLAGGGFINGGNTLYYEGVLGDVGVNPQLLRFNEEGDTLWRKVYPRDKFGTADKVIQCEDGGFALIGRTTVDTIEHNPQVLLIRTDSQGNMLWEREYGDSTAIGEYGTGIVEIPEQGGFFITGNWYAPPNIDALFMKVSADGELQWLTHFGIDPGSESTPAVNRCADGNFLLAGSQGISGDFFYTYRKALLRKFDIEGETIWETLIGNQSEMTYFTMVREDEEGNVVCSGNTAGVENYGKVATLSKYEGFTGDNIWYRTYHSTHCDNQNNSDENWDFTLLPDGGYALVGFTLEIPPCPYVSQDVWLIKVDEYGCVEPGCQLIDGLTDLNIGWEQTMSLYPVPLPKGSSMHISFSPADGGQTMPYAQEDTELLLMDLQGKHIARRPVAARGDSSSFMETWEIELASGNYLLHWMGSRGWYDTLQFTVE